MSMQERGLRAKLDSLESRIPRRVRSDAPDLPNIHAFDRMVAGDRPTAPEPARTDVNKAVDVLTRASRALDMMQTRYADMETQAKDLIERSKNDVAAAQAEIEYWEQRAQAIEAQLRRCESQLKECETQLASADQRAETAEQGMHEARDWLLEHFGRLGAPARSAA